MQPGLDWAVWSEAFLSKLGDRSEEGRFKTKMFAVDLDVQPDSFQPELGCPV